MNNDFAKSILDNPYNRVEGGQKIDLFDILSKYRYQHQNRQLTTCCVCRGYWNNQGGSSGISELDKRRQSDRN